MFVLNFVEFCFILTFFHLFPTLVESINIFISDVFFVLFFNLFTLVIFMKVDNISC